VYHSPVVFITSLSEYIAKFNINSMVYKTITLQKIFSHFIRMLAAIAFIPITNAVETFDTVVDAGYPDRTEPVVNYSEDNFIGRLDRRGNRRNPAFPLTLWNVYQRVVESLPRTNNSVGGWHCGFLTMLTSCLTN